MLRQLMLIGIIITSFATLYPYQHISDFSENYLDNKEIREQNKLKPNSKTTPQGTHIYCEDSQEHIQRNICRLNLNIIYTEPPEPCRNTNDSKTCLEIYTKYNNCKHLFKQDKDKCLFEISKDIDKKNQNRIYLILLLEELKAKTKQRHENKEIDTLKAATTITKIESIQKEILENKSKKAIKNKISTLINTIEK